jgi:hypothetical protein
MTFSCTLETGTFSFNNKWLELNCFPASMQDTNKHHDTEAYEFGYIEAFDKTSLDNKASDMHGCQVGYAAFDSPASIWLYRISYYCAVAGIRFNFCCAFSVMNHHQQLTGNCGHPYECSLNALIDKSTYVLSIIIKNGILACPDQQTQVWFLNNQSELASTIKFVMLNSFAPLLSSGGTISPTPFPLLGM